MSDPRNEWFPVAMATQPERETMLLGQPLRVFRRGTEIAAEAEGRIDDHRVKSNLIPTESMRPGMGGAGLRSVTSTLVMGGKASKSASATARAAPSSR